MRLNALAQFLSHEKMSSVPTPTPSAAEGIDLSKPLEKGQVQTIYIVHKGYMVDKKTNQKHIADEVCARTTKEDAESIAQMLNDQQESVFMLRWLASTGFPLAKGTGDEVIAKAQDEDILAQWEKIAAPLRKPIYQVSMTAFANEDEAKEFNQILEDESVKQNKQ